MIAALLGIMLAYSRFGEHSYLLGSSEEAAYRSGITVVRQKLCLHAIAGCAVGVAAVKTQHSTTSPTSLPNTTDLLAALSAAFIGGASLSGRLGNMIGSVVGVFIPAVLANGIIIAERHVLARRVRIILLAAVGFDHWRRRPNR